MADEIMLPVEFKERVKEAIDRSHKLDKFLTRVQLTDMDVTAIQKKNEDDRNKLLKIKQAFFPND